MDQGTKPTVSKWLWITLIVVALIAIIVGLWYYTMGLGKTTNNTTDDTITATETLLEGYSKYSNDTYGFSFQVPTTWIATKAETTAETSAGVLAKDLVYKIRFNDPNAVQKSGPVTSDDVYMRVYKKTSSYTTLNAWLLSTFKLPDSELENYAVGKTITLGGLKGYYSSIGCCAQVDRNYVVEKGDYIYSLGSGHFDNDISDADMPATFQKIAPTVKFIPISAAAAVTADWKTYTNTDYGFQLTFTDDWKDYKIEKDTSAYTMQNLGTKKAVYNLKVPSTDTKAGGTGFENLFNISVWNITDWDNAAAIADEGIGQGDNNIGDLIGKTSQYAISYHVTYQDISTVVREKFNPLIPALIQTFKVI